MTELASDEFEEISFISPSGDVLIRVYTPKQCTDPVDWGEFEEIERPAMLVRPGMFDMEVVTLTNPDGRWRRRIGTVRPTMNAAPSAASESAPLSDTNSPFVKHSLQTDGQSEVQYADGWEILYHDGSGSVCTLMVLQVIFRTMNSLFPIGLGMLRKELSTGLVILNS